MTGRLPGLLTALGVIAVAAGITAGSSLLPLTGLTVLTGRTGRPGSASAQLLPVSVSTPSLVCPGPETMLVPAGGQRVDPGAPVLLRALAGSSSSSPAGADLDLLGAGSGPVARGAASDQGVPESTGSSLRLRAQGKAVVLNTLAGSALGPAVLKADAGATNPGNAAPGTASTAPVLAAVQSTLVRNGDLRSLVATTCSVPRSESWLVGGGTVAGERLRLLLANPSSTPAVADIDVHGPAGRVDTPAGDGVVVPAGGEVPIFIDALAPGLARVAVHVTTRSGRVRATLHDSLLRGLTPAGADDVPIAAQASEKQVIPGVSPAGGASGAAGAADAGGLTSVRVAVPGSQEAVVRVRLLSSAGPVDLPSAVANVPAGAVSDIPISGVPAGIYTAVVSADVPVVAGALVGRGAVPGQVAAAEFGWAGSVQRLGGHGYVVLAPGTRSTVSLAAAGRTGRLVLNEVSADGSLGTPMEIEVPAGTSITEQLSAAAVAVRISAVGGGPVSASVLAQASDARGVLLSVLPIDLAAPVAAPRSAIEDARLGLH